MVIPMYTTNIILYTGGFYYGGFEMVSSHTQKCKLFSGNVANERVVLPSHNVSLILKFTHGLKS